MYVSKTLLLHSWITHMPVYLTHSLTPHYAVRSVIHARTGSALQQRKGDSQQPDATAVDPEHQHQRSQHLQSQRQRQHHRYLDPHRPTSDRRAAGREDDEVQVVRQVQVQIREVEAVVVAVVAAAAVAAAAGVAGVEAALETVEIAVVRVVVLEVAVAVEQLQVPMETHR
jgi:hypothetical protein